MWDNKRASDEGGVVVGFYKMWYDRLRLLL